jgi:hypothetical protein
MPEKRLAKRVRGSRSTDETAVQMGYNSWTPGNGSRRQQVTKTRWKWVRGKNVSSRIGKRRKRPATWVIVSAHLGMRATARKWMTIQTQPGVGSENERAVSTGVQQSNTWKGDANYSKRWRESWRMPLLKMQLELGKKQGRQTRKKHSSTWYKSGFIKHCRILLLQEGWGKWRVESRPLEQPEEVFKPPPSARSSAKEKQRQGEVERTTFALTTSMLCRLLICEAGDGQRCCFRDCLGTQFEKDSYLLSDEQNTRDRTTMTSSAYRARIVLLPARLRTPTSYPTAFYPPPEL